MNSDEVDRLLTIFMPMLDWETRAFIFTQRRRNRRFGTLFAQALGVPGLTRSDYANINRLQAHLAKLRLAEPEPEEEQDPTFQCMGCGPIAEVEGLRWAKLGRGEAVTVSIDHSAKPAALDWLTDSEIMRSWFAPWTTGNPAIRFQLLEGDAKGDCHIKWEDIDGPGGTLKFVWQPANGAEFMEQGGDLSGDMVCDASERSYPRSLVRLAGKHEVGHVLGIGHLESVNDVMYAFASSNNKPLSKSDKNEREERYPIGQAA